MQHKKRRRIICFGLFTFLISLPFLWISREVQQQSKDHALVEAIESHDDSPKLLELLAEGADGEAKEQGESPPLKEALLHLLDHFRHPGASGSNQATVEKHPPALLLLYQAALNKDPHHEDSGPDLAVVRALLDHGAQVNDRDAEGWTPLSYAATHTNSDTIRLLLARGADIETKDAMGRTPLGWAGAVGVSVLLEHGANIEARDANQMTPLICAVANRNTDAVRIFLKHGANIEATDVLNRTPLFGAVRAWNKPELVRIFLEQGANIEARDILKRTPLFYAVVDSKVSKHADVVRILLEHGAKVSPKDANGKTAFNCATNYSYPAPQEIAALLRKHGAK